MSNVLKSVPKITEAVAPPLECWDEANLLKTCRSPKWITLPNLTAVYHTAWAWITGWNKRPTASKTPKHLPYPRCTAVINYVALRQMLWAFGQNWTFVPGVPKIGRFLSRPNFIDPENVIQIRPVTWIRPNHSFGMVLFSVQKTQVKVSVTTETTNGFGPYQNHSFFCSYMRKMNREAFCCTLVQSSFVQVLLPMSVPLPTCHVH